MKSNLTLWLIKYDKFIPMVLFVLFVGITIPGIAWGAPDLWNPDELFWRVNKALIGEMKFDETEPDYNYPSLPKYVMYGVGWLVREEGGSSIAILVSARMISVVLGGLTVVLVYATAKLVSKNVYVRLLAAFLALTNTALSHNARFAHNDLYLLFFISLALYASIRFRLWNNRMWLYLAFFSTGCAASSKYTGASFIVVLFVLFLISYWRNVFSDRLRTLETLFIAGCLTVLGFVAGTPKALLWMSFYFKRMIPAALRFASYGRGPDSPIGLYGQWGTFRSAVGEATYCLFMISLIWFGIKLILHLLGVTQENENRIKVIVALALSIVIFDIPFLMSYNYVPRFFLPFLPMFAVLASLFFEDLLEIFRERKLIVIGMATGVILVLISSFLQIASVVLLFKNDARIPAGKFIKTLESEKVIEFTLYPPAITRKNFEAARNYPIYMVKYPGETVPTNKPYRYNEGEEGLFERKVDYLVVDNFTYARFSDDYICETNPVECDFFNRLLAGQTDLRLLASFEYSLPPYLPQISLAAVNPVVKVYEVPH